MTFDEYWKIRCEKIGDGLNCAMCRPHPIISHI